LQAVIQISTCFFFPCLPVFPSKMYLSIIHHPRWIGQWADKEKKRSSSAFVLPIRTLSLFNFFRSGGAPSVHSAP
jgi:hypothetical protein